MRPLTRRQAEVLEFMREFRRRKGFFPMLKEIGHGLGLAGAPGALVHVKILVEKGYLTKIISYGSWSARCYIVNPEVGIPVCEIVHGKPVLTGAYLARESVVQLP